MREEYLGKSVNGNNAGVDYAGYKAADTRWDLDLFECFALNKCT